MNKYHISVDIMIQNDSNHFLITWIFNSSRTTYDLSCIHQTADFLISQLGFISTTWIPLSKALETILFAIPVWRAVPITNTASVFSINALTV